jgi:hypothetical protein
MDNNFEEVAVKNHTASAAPEGQYVYCVIETGGARNFGPIGIGERGDAVITIAYRDLSTVVSSVPMDKYVVSSKTISAHERVIEMVMRDYTVLPVRFYTVAPNAEDIRNLLRRRYPEFKRLLREMDNKVELGLKCLWRDMNTVLKEVVEESKNRNATDQIIKLALQDKKAREGEPIIQPLRKISGNFCLNQTYGDDMLMNAAFLVDKSREKEFDNEVARLAARYEGRIAFKYIGPAPPYSFVNIAIEL